MTPQRVPEAEAVLDGRAVVVELWGPGDPETIAPAERPLVERAVASRLEQFAAGRQCARAALAALGVEPQPLLRDPAGTGRGPLWPDGVQGSISHTDGYAVAAVGTVGTPSIGVDAEQTGRVGRALFARLFVDAERRFLTSLNAAAEARVATELFGLKECYYKAQHPLTRAWVGFHDVAIAAHGDHPARDEPRRWVLARATDLDALDAVSWPCVGWSFMRRGGAADVALTLVEAMPAVRPDR